MIKIAVTLTLTVAGFIGLTSTAHAGITCDAMAQASLECPPLPIRGSSWY